MRKLIAVVVVLGLVGLAVFWFLTAPQTLAAADLPDHQADMANGERMFWVGGCKSCHAPAEATGEAALLLVGGDPLVTPFGTFYAPNISPDREDGIGGWSVAEFVNAMKHGVGRGGEHLYPSFPYASYQRMRIEDLMDLKAFMDTLPPAQGAAPPHDLPFPFTIRRGLGLWKLLFTDGETYVADAALDDEANLGAYLVQGPGHCGECHTPRNLLGAMDLSRWLAGGPSPEGEGTVPGITPHPDQIGGWSEEDIVFALSSGFTPDFEVLSGAMGPVVANLGNLDEADLMAMARYLKSVPAAEGDDRASE